MTDKMPKQKRKPRGPNRSTLVEKTGKVKVEKHREKKGPPQLPPGRISTPPLNMAEKHSLGTEYKAPNRHPHKPITDRFFLMNASGAYLHYTCKGTTKQKEYAFWGIVGQIDNLFADNYINANFRRVPWATVMGEKYVSKL